MVKSVLGGRAMQLMAIVRKHGDPPEIEYLYCWLSETGDDVAQVLFDSNLKVKQVIYNLAEEAPAAEQ